MNTGNSKFYKQQRDQFNTEKEKIRRTIQIVSLFRFITFLLIPFSLIYLTRFGVLAGITPAGFSLVIFLILVKKHIQLNKKKKRLEFLINICDDENLALTHSFSHFSNGKEFINPVHNYSYDLDLFGDGSLFQYINRTSTVSGKATLCRWMQEPPLQTSEIKNRQEAVKEIAGKRGWRMNFIATGKMFNETPAQHQEVIKWGQEELQFKNYNLTGILKIAIPVLTIIAIALSILANQNMPLYFFIGVQWLSLFLYRKRIKEYYKYFGQKSQLIEKYLTLISEIENENFSSGWMASQTGKIKSPVAASQAIGKLRLIVCEFDYRQNMLAGFILNSVFLWDIRCIYKLRKWHLENSQKLAGWLEVIENTDAIISLANFADNNQGYTFPELADGGFKLNADGLGHPLLHPGKRVCSDFAVDGWSKAIIVTGANMAGKSTFLRAVGVNIVLARLGAPVCAKSFLYSPTKLFTNMRTTDSLFNDESYFFAELKRLSLILGSLREGEELFIILDEMLKGTNSVDKYNGSKELIKKLIQLKSVALIATHDLKLSEMGNEFPCNIINKCFEIQIIDNELVFDYKLSNGVTQTMNATFLMKKMGII